jgi:hypothetical protein
LNITESTSRSNLVKARIKLKELIAIRFDITASDYSRKGEGQKNEE